MRIPCCVVTCKVRFAKSKPIPHLLAMSSGVTDECRSVAIADAVICLSVPVTVEAMRTVAESNIGRQRSSREGEIEDKTHADSDSVDSASMNRGVGR